MSPSVSVSLEPVCDLNRPALGRNRDELAAKSRRMGCVPMQAAWATNRPISAQPFGQTPFRAVCGVANPRHSGAMAAVCALQPIPKRYLRGPVEIANRLLRASLAALAAALLAAGCSSVDLGSYYEPPPVRMPEPLPPASAPASAALPQPATPQPVTPGQPVGEPLPPLGTGGPGTAAAPTAAPAATPTTAPTTAPTAPPVATPPPVDAHANLSALTTRLEAAAVNPPTRSAGIGRLDARYDADTGLLQWKASWAGLSGTITGVQFHGPAGMDQNGPPTMIWPAPFGPTYEGRATLTPQQAQDLLAGRWYVNVFTSAYPAGELRGQLRVVR